MEEQVVTKTIEEWLNELDEPYRTQAIENTKNLTDTTELGRPARGISDALGCAFIWNESTEGYIYWSALYSKYLK